MISSKTSGKCGECITNEQSLAKGGPREMLAGEMTELPSHPFCLLGCILYQTTSHDVLLAVDGRVNLKRSYPSV